MLSFLLLTLITFVLSGNPENYENASSIYEFTAQDIKGHDIPLEKYKGHVLLIVNVASFCDLTERNYEQLNKLYDEYAESNGLRILAFPSNQFKQQEPGTNEEIAEFAAKHGAKFDLFSKIDVNGENAHAIYKYLKYKQPGANKKDSSVEWNFTKFIVDKNGQVVERYPPQKDPLDLVPSLQKYF